MMAVGFFTQGISYVLPHPKISPRIVLLICQVIIKAWHLLEENPPPGFFIRSADEDTITQLLVEIIENRLRKTGEIAGFNCVLFGKVIRDPKIANFDKQHPDKMPDIFFDLKRDKLPILNDQDGLFVECKPVDHKHPIFSYYCNKGLIRFVNGDYAWAMQDALMLGYVMGRYSYKDLAIVLNNAKKRELLNTDSHSSVEKYPLYCSKHVRKFCWPDNYGRACSIYVSHLWLLR